LATAAEVAGDVVPVFLDVNVGMDRTGVPPGSDAAHHLLQALHDAASLELAGLHIYDGHQRATDLTERTAAVQEQWQQIETLRTWCRDRGIVLPKLVCGGTPTFPVYCGFEDPDIELSPGTSIFYDVGYGQLFPDLPFQPAAAVLTRVVSCPGRNRITLDLGTKAVASDPPKGSRVVFPELPGSVQIGHNEEHLQLEVPEDSTFVPGDVLLAIPTHVCPTSALYDRVPVVEGGQIVDYWEVTARSRAITV
jgi:D-serine deaminase-like pyridoxal phosphate-dependent protein